MWNKIKSRLPGGLYFKSLMDAFRYIAKGHFDFGFKYIIMNYFLDSKYTNTLFYQIIQKSFSKGNYFDFYGLHLPIFENNNYTNFVSYFFDFMYPRFHSEFNFLVGEGPYLYKNVQINRGDIVIDAGTNIGLFSALTSHLGGIIYAFESVKEIREKYLEKTAQLNKICY